MSKYVPDILSRRWVIISPQRIKRPDEYGNKKVCPFCPGHENETPAEVLRYNESTAKHAGWKVRVIPNKYPITDLHEVIIHGPSCDQDLEDFPVAHVALVLKAYKERFNFYRKRGQVLIFGNHGEHAGASLSHPHSQLVVIPSQINLDTLSREPLNNLLFEDKYFNVYCPDFSQWPYEVWIAAKRRDNFFGDIDEDNEIKYLAAIFKKILQELRKIYKKHQISGMPFGYNYYIYPKENWYLRIIPRFIHRAGFELGTGLSVNIVDPLNAALEFKGVDERTRNVLNKLKKHI